MILLGIDPGTAETGYGVIAVQGSRLDAVDHGLIATSAREPLEQRLVRIFAEVSDLIAKHEPASVALEDLFVGGNPRTILSVGHARGAVLTACGRAGIPAAGYPPAEVKMTVCGFGRADKSQVQRMVTASLRLDRPPASEHAADALAVAVCHAHASRTNAALKAAAG
jgi:crossover junction endodeoxyribonuclease RuvC